MSNISDFLINFNEETCETLILKFFNSFKESKNLIIPPWSEPNFWDNMKINLFLEHYIKLLFEILRDEINSKKKSNLNFESYLLTLLHIIYSFKNKLNEKFLTEFVNNLFGTGNLMITHVMFNLSKTFNSNDINFKIILDFITKKHDHKILSDSLPFFNLIFLIRYFKEFPQNIPFLIISFKKKLEISKKKNECFLLLYLINLFITIFPGINKELLEELKIPLINFLNYPLNISSFTDKVGKLLIQEINYPSSNYFELLKTISINNIQFNNCIPLLYDHKNTFLPNFLSSRQIIDFSLENCYLSFAKNYLKMKFNIKKDKPIKFLFKFIKKLKFDEKTHNKLLNKYKLNSEFLNNEIKFDLEPPLIKLNLTKFSINFEYSTQLVTKINDNEFLFISPIVTIFETQIIIPILNYIQNNNISNFNCNILFCGDDLFFSNILLAFIINLNKYKENLKDINFKWFFYPIINSEPSLISNYLSSQDPIYSKFINNIYNISSLILPNLNENSNFIFPNLINSNDFLNNNHLWFTTPSPSTLIQFSIQHYLLFAQNYINFNIWKAILEYDEKNIVIPFITSLQIGNQFLNNKLNDSIKSKNALINLNNEEISLKFTSLIIWNINENLNIHPNQNQLLLEYLNDLNIDIIDREI